MEVKTYLMKRTTHFQGKLVHSKDFKRKIVLVPIPDGKLLLTLLNDAI